MRVEVKDLIKMLGKKKELKVKSSQYERVDGKVKCIFDMKGVGVAVLKLEEMGYKCSFTKTDKQVTVGYKMGGEISKVAVRDLITINLVVKKQ